MTGIRGVETSLVGQEVSGDLSTAQSRMIDALRALRTARFTVIADVFISDPEGLRGTIEAAWTQGNESEFSDRLAKAFGKVEAKEVARRVVESRASSSEENLSSAVDLSSVVTVGQLGLNATQTSAQQRQLLSIIRSVLGTADVDRTDLEATLSSSLKEKFFEEDSKHFLRSRALAPIVGLLSDFAAESVQTPNSDERDGSLSNFSFTQNERSVVNDPARQLLSILDSGDGNSLNEFLSEHRGTLREILTYQPMIKKRLLDSPDQDVAARVLETLLVSSTERHELGPLLQAVNEEVIFKVGADGWGAIRERLGFEPMQERKTPTQTVLDAIREFDDLHSQLGLKVIGRLLQLSPKLFQDLSSRDEAGPVTDFDPRSIEKVIAQRNFSDLPPHYREIVQEYQATNSEVSRDEIQHQVERELSAYLSGKREMPEHFKVALGELFEELDNAPLEEASKILARLQNALEAQLERELVLLNQYGQRNLQIISNRLRDQFLKEKIGYTSEQAAFSLLNDEGFRDEMGIRAVYKSSKWSLADRCGGDLMVVMETKDQGPVAVTLDIKSRIPDARVDQLRSDSFLPPLSTYVVEGNRLLCWPAEVVVMVPGDLPLSKENLRQALSAGAKRIITPWG